MVAASSGMAQVVADHSGFVVSVLPNPVTNVANIKIQGAGAGPVQLLFTNMNGEHVKKMSVPVGDGVVYLEKNVEDRAPGVYVLIVRQGGRTGRWKVVIVR